MEPRDWYRHANGLKESAEILIRAMGESRKRIRPMTQEDLLKAQADFSTEDLLTSLARNVVFLLLDGLAAENLLKGICHSKELLSREDMRRRWTRKGHSLLKLAAEAGISLTPSEEKLLERLTEQVKWAARYPLSFSDESDAAITFIPAEFNELYDKLSQEFDRTEAARSQLTPDP